MEPTQEKVKSRWGVRLQNGMAELEASCEEIEGDPSVVLVDREKLAELASVARRGQGVDDVELWIWDHAPTAFKRAKKLLMNPSFLRAAKRRP